MTDISKSEIFVSLALRRVARKYFGLPDKFETTSDYCDYLGQDSSDIIAQGITSAAPFAVSRFGHSELRAVLTYLHIKESGSHFRKLANFVKGDKVEPWWHKNTIRQITFNAGLFPVKLEMVEAFCELILSEIGSIDVLGSWLGGERWLKPKMANAKFIRFHDFYHFLHTVPWTKTLEGKNVLVVHPFDRSIESQYLRKDKIFEGKDRLPDFNLSTYRSVQSIAGNQPPKYKDWFEALDAMKFDIAQKNFDVAILGCGAYGMPLATYIKKSLGRKAIHLGGNVQILFGIRGGRWDNDPVFQPYFNEYWSRPLREETPKGHGEIDDNCYW